MSLYRTYFNITETQVDLHGKVKQKMTTDLPHHDFICEAMCRSWNDAHMEHRFTGILKDKIINTTMTHEQGPGQMSYGIITVTGKPGLRMTRKTKNEIEDQITEMFSGEWGNTFFGTGHTMTAPDGITLFVTQSF